jgi:hypothetical protein
VTYLAKVAAGGFLLAFFETSIAKMRVFRVPQFMGCESATRPTIDPSSSTASTGRASMRKAMKPIMRTRREENI